jgi:hypothetical protein
MVPMGAEVYLSANGMAKATKSIIPMANTMSSRQKSNKGAPISPRKATTLTFSSRVASK